MKNLIFAILLLLIPAFASCASAQDGSRAHLATPQTLNFKGTQRTYRIFVPERTQGKLPLVFVFHGGGGDGKGTEGLTKFSLLAQREGFIVVYPDGFKKNWNDGREDIESEAFTQKIDDLGFIRELIAEISRKYQVDEKRIYSTGISNGGIFSHYLAANYAEKIAAIAPVVGGIADPFYKDFKPKEAVSVFIIQGTEDPLTPYDGGGIAKGKRGQIVSTDKAISLWAGVNGIEGDPIRGSLPNTARFDGCTVETYSWSGGKNGTEIKLYKQIGAGHTWPGGGQYMPKMIIGSVCRDFNATDEIWKFFKAHPKR